MHSNVCLTLFIWVLRILAVQHVEMSEKSFHLVVSLIQTLYMFFSFAFVEFESTDEAKDALENLNNTEIEGRTIRLEYSQNSGRGDGGRGNSGRFQT